MTDRTIFSGRVLEPEGEALNEERGLALARIITLSHERGFGRALDLAQALECEQKLDFERSPEQNPFLLALAPASAPSFARRLDEELDRAVHRATTAAREEGLVGELGRILERALERILERAHARRRAIERTLIHEGALEQQGDLRERERERERDETRARERARRSERAQEEIMRELERTRLDHLDRELSSNKYPLVRYLPAPEYNNAFNQPATPEWLAKWPPSHLPSICIQNYNASCNICLQDFNEPQQGSSVEDQAQGEFDWPEPLRQLACRHVFHLCIDSYLEIDKSARYLCPICHQKAILPVTRYGRCIRV